MFDTKQKYVRLGKYNEFIIFPVTIEHSEFKRLNPISAGFCYINNGKVNCFGESYTLSLKSEEDDSLLATKQIFGIDAVLEIESNK